MQTLQACLAIVLGHIPGTVTHARKGGGDRRGEGEQGRKVVEQGGLEEIGGQAYQRNDDEGRSGRETDDVGPHTRHVQNTHAPGQALLQQWAPLPVQGNLEVTLQPTTHPNQQVLQGVDTNNSLKGRAMQSMYNSLAAF